MAMGTTRDDGFEQATLLAVEDLPRSDGQPLVRGEEAPLWSEGWALRK